MLPQDLPSLVIVRVLTAAGPYATDDTLSVAFITPTIGRLVAHDYAERDLEPSRSPVPETISVIVTHAAAPYPSGSRLALSFIDPRIARIHPTDERRVDWRSADAHTEPALSIVNATQDDIVLQSQAAPEFSRSPFAGESNSVIGRHEDSAAEACDPSYANRIDTRPSSYAAPDPADETIDNHDSINGVRVTLRWNADRIRRFVQVVDKLFTVDRLGWYRHAFAMRLLVPDEISCGNAMADAEAMRYLIALRAAAVETLGRPLLAAFMPNFSVSSEWLDSLDNPSAAKAIASLRESILPYASDRFASPVAGDARVTTGTIARQELLTQPVSTVESVLPIFIASHTTNVSLDARFSAYRGALVDVFGQTARSPEAVRLHTMTQPNHSLDDRLWQFVGAVGESLGGVAVA